MRNAYTILVGTSARKRQARRPCCRWENITKAVIKDIGYD
jgi:hypothetical protein